MLIGIDANEANLTANRVGINEYAFNLLHAVYQLKTGHEFVVYLKTPVRDDLPKERKGWHYRVIPFPAMWTQTRLPFDLYIHTPRPDIFLSLTHYAPRWCPCPSVVSIMDLGFLSTPEQFTKRDFNQLKSWTGYSIRQAAAVLAISEYTKKDIEKYYHKDPAKIVVTPLAYNQKLFKPTHDQRILDKYGIKKPYILFLSSLKPSKNIDGLVRAFAKLSLQDLPVGAQLVIAGKKAWLYDQIFALTEELNLQGKVIFTGFVGDPEKPVLMSSAGAFVLPSFFEGFGIPVLEAMACAVPVVVSKVASLPEVAGEAGIYVDPASVDSIAEGIKIALSEKSAKFVHLGLKRVKSFSWAKTAKLTLATLESCSTAKTSK